MIKETLEKILHTLEKCCKKTHQNGKNEVDEDKIKEDKIKEDKIKEDKIKEDKIKEDKI
ncbi:hypothetical protein IO388_001597, partial [Campylobacter lari]|nr:hypothetical protein [Campylobacter lari]